MPSHPELDYAFVSHDESTDPYVRGAVEAGFFTDERRYTASLQRLREHVLAVRAVSTDASERRTCIL